MRAYSGKCRADIYFLVGLDSAGLKDGCPTYSSLQYVYGPRVTRFCPPMELMCHITSGHQNSYIVQLQLVGIVQLRNKDSLENARKRH